MIGLLSGGARAAALSTQEGVREISQATVITSPGAYLVTRDLLVLGGSAITIQADDVTLDLNGHRIQSVPVFGTYDAAIRQQDWFANLSVFNGTVIGGAGAGIWATGRNSRVENVTVRGSQKGGILLGDMAVVENCIVVSNDLGLTGTNLICGGAGSRVAGSILIGNTGARLVGIRGGQGCIVDGCILRGNLASYYFNGVELARGGVVRSVSISDNYCASSFSGVVADGTIERCAVVRNIKDMDGGSLAGIDAGVNGVVRRCIVKENTAYSGEAYAYFHRGHGGLFDCVAFSNVAVGASAYGFCLSTNNTVASRCAATANGSRGFYGPIGCIIKQSVAKWNGWYGIDVGAWSSVERCLVDNTGDATDTRTGIAANNGNVRVENNHVLDSGRGIGCFGGVNFLSGNSAVNTTNYVNTTGQSCGAITNQPGANFISYNPWQNFGL